MCGEHVFHVVSARNGEEGVLQAPTSKKFTRPNTFVQDLLKIAEKLETEFAADERDEEEEEEEQPQPEPEDDELSTVFRLVRPYIQRTCFFYAYLITALRQIAHLDHIAGYCHGEHFSFMQSEEGRDIFNFFAVFYTAASCSVIDALRGVSISRQAAS